MRERVRLAPSRHSAHPSLRSFPNSAIVSCFLWRIRFRQTRRDKLLWSLYRAHYTIIISTRRPIRKTYNTYNVKRAAQLPVHSRTLAYRIKSRVDLHCTPALSSVECAIRKEKLLFVTDEAITFSYVEFFICRLISSRFPFTNEHGYVRVYSRIAADTYYLYNKLYYYNTST